MGPSQCFSEYFTQLVEIKFIGKQENDFSRYSGGTGYCSTGVLRWVYQGSTVDTIKDMID